MKYKIQQTLEAEQDILNFVDHMISEFKDPQAASHFLSNYFKKAYSLETFPFGYRGVSFEYRGNEIRLKPYDTYNIFFIVGLDGWITILRVLKDKQDWKAILNQDTE